jgi:hypothetical protein
VFVFQLVEKGAPVRARHSALVIHNRYDASGALTLYQIKHILIIREGEVIGIDVLSPANIQLVLECMLVEVLLKLLVGVVYTKLYRKCKYDPQDIYIIYDVMSLCPYSLTCSIPFVSNISKPNISRIPIQVFVCCVLLNLFSCWPAAESLPLREVSNMA